ncbi:hypothetical protein BB561_001107 [Smittium simulii]|uniref:CUE domain-containing protein n=1 Tax=Smittium simulii TaxID=133385 RepID=A0A2T9YW27_9FUNG|nr:hypothetical protein BB561_001107 [Smittium simulii]
MLQKHPISSIDSIDNIQKYVKLNLVFVKTEPNIVDFYKIDQNEILYFAIESLIKTHILSIVGVRDEISATAFKKHKDYMAGKAAVPIKDFEQTLSRELKKAKDLMFGIEGLDFLLDFYINILAIKDIKNQSENLKASRLFKLHIMMDLSVLFGKHFPDKTQVILDSSLKNFTWLFDDLVDLFRSIKTEFCSVLAALQQKSTESNLPETLYILKKLSDTLFYINHLAKISTIAASFFSQKDNFSFIELLIGIYNSKDAIKSKSADLELNSQVSFNFFELRWAILNFVSNIISTLSTDMSSNSEIDTISATNLFSFYSMLLNYTSSDSFIPPDSIVPFESGNILSDLCYFHELYSKIEADIEKIETQPKQSSKMLVDIEQAKYMSLILDQLKNSISKKYFEGLANYVNKVDEIANNVRYSESDVNTNIINSESTEISINKLSEDETRLVEIFPDYSSDFLLKMLEEKNNNFESCVTYILENPNLVEEYMNKEDCSVLESNDNVGTIEPINSVLASRRNIFDNDEFDVFSGKLIDKSRVHIKAHKHFDRQKTTVNESTLSDDYKKKIMEAAKLLEDDEYDDTFDDEVHSYALDETVSDSEATLNKTKLGNIDADNTQAKNKPFNEPEKGSSNNSFIDSYLSKYLFSNPEQIEGWYSILNRNPKAKEKLINGFQDQNPNKQLKVDKDKTQISTTLERHNKQKNKSSHGNHNRKAAHSRKANIS